MFLSSTLYLLNLCLSITLRKFIDKNVPDSYNYFWNIKGGEKMGIKTARKKAGLTQEELASKLGINRATLSKYESGGISPTMEMVINISFALNCDIKELLDPEYDSNDLPQLIKFSDRESLEPTNSPSFIREGELLRSFSVLNDEGQQKVVDYAKDLSQMAKYRFFIKDTLGKAQDLSDTEEDNNT